MSKDHFVPQVTLADSVLDRHAREETNAEIAEAEGITVQEVEDIIDEEEA